MLAWVFPGQGSQKRGMGGSLFDEVKEYAAVEREVDALLGYSLRELCLEDPHNRLRETQFTQPSLYVVNALHYYKAIATDAPPQYVAGHSLGEYNALLAAGVFDFLMGLRLVRRRGELMAMAKNGGMGAVIGMEGDVLVATLRANSLQRLDVANFNSPTQIVISGPVEDIKRAGPVLEAAGARMYMPLPVSAAFHSRYMAEAAESLKDAVTPMHFAAPRVPVVANVTAELYPTYDASEAVKSLLVQQITKSVRWTESVRFLTDRGVSEFRELGPGNVLTRLIQQIRQVK